MCIQKQDDRFTFDMQLFQSTSLRQALEGA